jgi:hypothetical protein
VSPSHLLIAALLLAPLAMAQEKAGLADRADPDATAPPLRYESAFNSYRPFAETGQAPDKVWRDANRQVGELGGHVGHIAQEPPAAAVQATPPTDKPERAGSPGHQHH